MLRITYPKSISDDWRSKKTISDVQQRRVYRWGATWAYANPWKVEKRTVLQEHNGILLELCTPTSDHQPPYEVEDMWDEEVVLLPHIEYTGLLSLVGTPQDLQVVIAREGLPNVDLPKLSAPIQPVKHMKPNTKPVHKSRCLIAD